MNDICQDAGAAPWSPPASDEVVELQLLLLRREADALEHAASRRNTTPAELLRRLVWQFVQGEARRHGRGDV